MQSGVRMQVPGANAPWRKSSRSGSVSNCVEVAVAIDAVGVRDTKDREGAVLAFSNDRWADFVRALR